MNCCYRLLLYKLRITSCTNTRKSFAAISFKGEEFIFAVAIRTGTVRRVWFAIRTAVGIFLAIVGEIFVCFDFYNLTLINQY